MENNSPFNLSAYSFGYWSISYYSVDNAGNVEGVHTLTVKLIEISTAKKEVIAGYNFIILLGIIGIISIVIFHQKLK